MQKQRFRVSVLMSVYNCERHIQKAIESIQSQTFRDFEFLIVNDGSTDQTLSILEEMKKKDERIRLFFHSKNVGLTKSLNELLQHANGDFIVRMDADDVSDPTRIEKQIKYLESHPNVAMIGSCGNYLDQYGEVVGEKLLPTTDIEIKKRLLKNNQFIHSSLCIRKKVLDEIGWYDPLFERSQDYDLVLRIAARHEVANLQESLISWRISSTSLSWINKQQEIDAIRARWKAITVYGYPFLLGLTQIIIRIGWLLIPQDIKRKRYEC